MTLRQKQSKFVVLVAKLINYATGLGYELTFGEAYRSPDEAKRQAKLGLGIKNSLHGQRLAIDLNLFINGKYMMATEAHAELGKWWEEQSGIDYQCVWGGKFGDGNHYSIAHGGRK